MNRIARTDTTTEARTTTISKVDPFGVTHFARVSWRPVRSDVSAGLTNTGRALTAWEDQPPVKWTKWADAPTLHLREDITRFTGDTEEVVVGVEAADPHELAEGDFYVHETWTKKV